MDLPAPLTVLEIQFPWMLTHPQPWEWQCLPASAKEAKAKGLSRYFTGDFCENGHRAYRLVSTYGCAMCAAIKRCAKTEAEKERGRKASREWRMRNLEAQRERERRWHHENPEKSRERARVKYHKNRKKIVAYVCAREKRVRQATPRWANMDAIRAFYEARPEGHHVDHIIPLNGKNVCGLHVLENLQYLPASENCRKRNIFNG
jgi:hypothetical protein